MQLCTKLVVVLVISLVNSAVLFGQDSTTRALLIKEAERVYEDFKTFSEDEIAVEVSLDSDQEGATSHGSGWLVSQPRNGHMLMMVSHYFSTGAATFAFYRHSSDLFYFTFEQLGVIDDEGNPTTAHPTAKQSAVIYQGRLLSTSYELIGETILARSQMTHAEFTEGEIVSEYHSLLNMIDKYCDTCSSYLETQMQYWILADEKLKDSLAPYLKDPITEKPIFPLVDGEYEFVLRFAEHPSIIGPRMKVIVKGDSIYFDEASEKTSLSGRMKESGLLLWHPATQQWTLGWSKEDENAPEVGGCTDGPYVIDPRFFIVWTC